MLASGDFTTAPKLMTSRVLANSDTPNRHPFFLIVGTQLNGTPRRSHSSPTKTFGFHARRLTHEEEFSRIESSITSRHQSFTDCTIDTLPTPTTPTTIETMEHSQLTSLQLSPSSPVSPLMSSRRRSRRACVGFVALAVGKSSGSDTCWLAWWIVTLLLAVPSKLACIL